MCRAAPVLALESGMDFGAAFLLVTHKILRRGQAPMRPSTWAPSMRHSPWAPSMRPSDMGTEKTLLMGRFEGFNQGPKKMCEMVMMTVIWPFRI